MTSARHRRLGARALARTAALAAAVGGCASSGPSVRSLHYVDDTLVHSPTVHHQAYAAYLRARLAMEAESAEPAVALTVARAHLDAALQVAPYDPHLWTTVAEVELRRGNREAALAASRRALTYRPEYAPARQLLVRLESEGAGDARRARR